MFLIKYQLIIFAVIVLILIYTNVRIKINSFAYQQKLFLLIISTNILMLVLDAATIYIDGKPGLITKEVNWFVELMYYIFNPLPCLLWCLYCDYQINRNEKHVKKIILPLLLPFILNAILSVLSLLNGMMFYIDNNNIYHRGSFFIVLFAVSYYYFVFSIVNIIRKKNLLERDIFLPLILFGLPPFIAGILQSLFFGSLIIWPSMAISLFIIFISIQNRELNTDYLTGLYNRRQLDRYLEEKVKNISTKKLLAGIMLDINKFKEINDIYGHSVGDEALINLSGIIKRSCSKDCFLSRYAGDEFVIILELNEQKQLPAVIDAINNEIEIFNEKRITPYKLSVSIGYDVMQKNFDAQQFMRHIDQLMYKVKQSKKNKYIV